MESDKYKVHILHYLNPHLIWVLVEGEDNSFSFEQIGIYGLLPLDIAIDMEGNVTTKRCEEWLPAVFVAMKKIFLEASEAWFSVYSMDKTTSIFDDNLHKYGDLIIKMKSGKTVSLQKELLDTNFAAEDYQNFDQYLNTKLDYVKAVSVTNSIKQSIKSLNKPTKQLMDIFMTQTSIFQKTVELEETTPRNLEIGYRDQHALLLRKQMNNLNVCKDVDEISAGRANSGRTVSNSELKAGLLKKLSMIRTESVNSKLNAVSPTKNHEHPRCDLLSKNENLDINQEEIEAWNEKDPKILNYQDKRRKMTKGKQKQVKDTKNKKYIAFGPPGLKPTQFLLKEVAIEEQPPVQNIIENNETENQKLEQDEFERADSDINIEINNLDTLKNIKINENNIINNNSKTLNHSLGNGDVKNCAEDFQNLNSIVGKKGKSLFHRKMKILQERLAKENDSSTNTDMDSSATQGDDSDSESITALVDKLDISNNSIKKQEKAEPEKLVSTIKHNVNPFKNLDGSKSVFVEKLIRPTLMVHTKKGNRIQPVSDIRDVPFGMDIHIILRNMSVNKPMRVQTVSWPTILRGYSLFLVSPYDSGKTLGYLPAVCRLVSDCRNIADSFSVARLSCIIVCATAKSVAHVEFLCKMFLHEARIFACYAGMTDISISTTMLNGCDILICTPTLLVRLMRDNLGLDLRSLNTFVIDDCERISEVYKNELKFCLFKVREMLKSRVNKEVKVQYIVVSRIWCSFMSSLAKKAADSVVCIAAFQECVLYSEVNTSVEFLKKDDKINAVVNFLKNMDKSKKSVIACRSDEEVHLIRKALTNLKYVVFACDSTMTVQDLYNIDLALSEYKEPILGPILVCCDGNLTHLNITDAHYLIHFSLPELFSLFCKRFAVLIDNYQSIFNKQDSDVKIKIFLENSNIEQLPKILNFVKRCTDNVPSVLDEISATVMSAKNLKKAQVFVPLCNTLLTLGICPDIWNCQQRHGLFQDFDNPKSWLPSEGTIAFKILHYHSPVMYSVRMISCTTNNEIKKFPQTYSMLSIKLGMYYSRDINRKLHGIAKPGDICAVSLKLNLFARCQIIKILSYTQNNLPNIMLINLIDEEKYETARDTCLYYLPDDLKNIETHVARVVLANLSPQDKDITYSKLAEDQLKKITESNEDIYMRGQTLLVVGNCIFVETLEACQDLSSMNETVVRHNFKKELLDGYAVNNPDHISAIKKLGEELDFMRKKEVEIQSVVVPKPIKVLPKASWAHLESDSDTPVFYLYAKSPVLFFVQHVKFQELLQTLLKDIQKYVSENPEPVTDFKEGDIVLAEFPGDSSYERARIDSVISSENVKCFFVDLGDWGVVPVKKLLSITEKMVTRLPFQAIECRLVGIKPLGDEWSQFSTNWLVDQFYDTTWNLKYLYAKRFTKEKAEYTEGSKYGICLIDTYADDVCINKLMLDANLAEENEEIDFLNNINLGKVEKTSNSTIAADSNVLEKSNEIVNIIEDKQEDNSPKSISSFLLSRAQEKEAFASNNDYLERIHKKSSNSSETFQAEINKRPHKKDHSKEEKNGVSASYNDFLEPKSIEALNNTKYVDKKDVSSSSSSNISSDDNVRTNQQTIMKLFRNNPLRTVPLVGGSDFDDKRWDSFNPVSMLLNSKTASSNEGLVPQREIINEPKIIPLAINNTESNYNVNVKPVAELDTQKNVPKISNIAKTDHCSAKITAYEKSNDNQQDTESKDSNITVNHLHMTTDSKSVVKSDNVNWSIIENNDTIQLYENMISNKAEIFKLTWTQDSKNVTIKIAKITGKYELFIEDKEIQFYTKVNDTEYGFQFELYGVVDIEKSSHCSKGTVVEIYLSKLMSKNWLSLRKGDVKKKNAFDDEKSNESKGKKDKIIDLNLKGISVHEDSGLVVSKGNQLENCSSFKPQVNEADNLRKPRVVWRQNKDRVIIKILLITEKYALTIKDRYLQLSANANDEEYGFDFELYGVVDTNKSSHSNKGQYIQINLRKVMAKNWLTLSKGSPKKWIIYDVDNIDVSSEDEQDNTDDIDVLKKNLKLDIDSDSDEDFNDDTNFGGYKRDF